MRATVTIDELHQEEPTTTGKDIKQEGTSALALREEQVIEGEVIAVIEPEQKPTPKQRPYYLIVVFTILACLLFTGVSLLAPLFTLSATVTIFPREEHLSITGDIDLHARLLPALTLSQSATVPATGKRHLDARRAHGTITFYNGLFTSQTIEAGTILTGADGVEVITDQPAIIPAGNPPVYGQVTVSAHALHPGDQGNIAASNVNTVCCATSVLAKNTQAFTGGAEARDFLVVTKEDINAARGAILPILEKSEQAALHPQINPGEALVTPSCKKQTTSDHNAGEEATEVHITVSETCEGVAYAARELHQNTQQMITKKALKRFGAGFHLRGDLQVSIVQATVTYPNRGIVTLAVKTEATYVYQITPGEKQLLLKLVAGRSKQQAVKALFQLPGIQAASIQLPGGNTALPDDPNHIHIIVIYRSS